jgi:hypothetical protein
MLHCNKRLLRMSMMMKSHGEAAAAYALGKDRTPLLAEIRSLKSSPPGPRVRPEPNATYHLTS